MWKNLIIVLLALSLIALATLRFSEPKPPTQVPTLAPAVEDPPIPKPDDLTTLLQDMQAAPGFEAASIGFCLLGDSPAPLINYRAGEAMTPASTLKAVTSATALEQLGPDFRFTTQLASTKPFTLATDGSFDGDLLLIGGGDPMLTAETFFDWAQELQTSGLTKLTGNIIANAQHFPEQMIPNAWDWGDVSNYYGAGPSGLNLDFNRFLVTFNPGEAVGSTPGYEMEPHIPWLQCQNLTQTVVKAASSWTSAYGGPYADTLTFRGHVPLESETVICEAAIPDPAFYATWVFQQALEAAGIEFKGTLTTQRRLQLVKQSSTEATAILKKQTSASLKEIIRYLHRTSDNMVTECLFQTLIKQDPLQRSGVEIVAEHWQNRGLTMKGLRMEDGSGLARADFIRPIDLARVLWLARRGPHGDVYSNTLNRYHDDRVRWKGGAMSRVRAYTGFVQSDSGKELTFAFMINNYEASTDAIATWRGRLVEFMLER